MQENAEYILTSLPGTVTFAPGDVGFSIFGALHPMEKDIKHIAGLSMLLPYFVALPNTW